MYPNDFAHVNIQRSALPAKSNRLCVFARPDMYAVSEAVMPRWCGRVQWDRYLASESEGRVTSEKSVLQVKVGVNIRIATNPASGGAAVTVPWKRIHRPGEEEIRDMIATIYQMDHGLDDEPTELTEADVDELGRAIERDHARAVSGDVPTGEDLLDLKQINPAEPIEATSEDEAAVQAFLAHKRSSGTLTEKQKDLAMQKLFGEKFNPVQVRDMLNQTGRGLDTFFDDIVRIRKRNPVVFGQPVHVRQRTSKTRKKKKRR